MNRSILTVVALGLLAAGANADCVQIGTFAQLQAFAATVNGGTTDACGELTANITANESAILDGNGQLLTDADGRRLDNIIRWQSLNSMKNFTGTFDGKGFTISSMYAEAALFKSVGDGAKLNDIHITDTYVNEPSGYVAAALVDSVISGSVAITNCSFNGTVASADYSTGGSYIGGLIGKVSSGSVTISNSSVSGRIIAADLNTFSENLATETLKSGSNMGGLIGGIESGASVKVLASTASATVETGDASAPATVNPIIGSGSATTVNVGCSKNVSACTDGKTDKELSSLRNSVAFSYVDSKLVATVYDTVRTFSLDNDITVDSVILARTFTANVPATVMLPFEIALSNIAGGTFGRLETVNIETKSVVMGSEYGTAFSYAPYVVALDDGVTELTFKGSVTLKATTDANTAKNAWNNPCANSGGWRMMGSTAVKGWTTTGVNKDEIGYVYGFVGEDLADASSYFDVSGEATIGQFVKIKDKVKVDALRGYMKYVGDECPTTSKKPTASGEMMNAPSTTALSAEDLPESFDVIMSIANTSDEVLTLQKVLSAPAAAKANRWFDVTGRSMMKPNAHGVYLNDRKPVVVK